MDSPEVIKGQVLYDTMRSASAVAASGTGAVTVWTPAAGKSIRIGNYLIEASGGTTTAGGATVTATVAYGGVTLGSHTARVGTTAVNGMLYALLREFEGGMLLPVGVALTLTLSSAINAGAVTLYVFGREE